MSLRRGDLVTKRNLAKALIEGLEEIRAWKHGRAKLRTNTLVASTEPAVVRGAFEKLARLKRNRRAAR
jgi:hypothetical protein